MSNNSTRVISILCFIAFFIFIAWYFSNIAIYMFVALILTIIGSPIVKMLSLIKIRKKKIPRSLVAIISLVILLTLIGLFFWMLIPSVMKELSSLTTLDVNLITSTLTEWLQQVDLLLKEYKILSPDENFAVILIEYVRSMVSKLDIASLFGGTVSIIASMFIGIFSVVFMTYFSLKDNRVFVTMIKKVIPVSYRKNFDHILSATKKQLVRYFSGVLMEMIIMGVIEALFAYFLKLPNPLLIGFLGGLLNVIPYLGPLMGAVINIIISVTVMIPIDPSQAVILMTIAKVIVVFVVANLIDNFILQPNIYGRSVKAHPLEIFIVILCAAKIGGVLGMILAVPAYSLLRIIVREFFGQYYFREEPKLDLEPDPLPVLPQNDEQEIAK